MNTSLLFATLISIACFISTSLSQERTDAALTDDPFRWLEDIEGPAAVAWVRAENEKTLGCFNQILAIRTTTNRRFPSCRRIRIAEIPLEGRGLEHFWQDENQVRGVWRRTARESDRSQDPKWEAILEVDALAVAENRNWVFRGASCLPPEERLCLVSLSDGGKNAVSIREFDRIAKTFVANGFYLPEGKQDIRWVDGDTLLVARDWGEGTLTQAGYPFVVKEVKRAQSLSETREIFRGEPADSETQPLVLRDSEGHIHATGAVRAISSFESEYVVFRPDGPV
ncbi:S9 family peptidase [Bradyrhizobium sp. 138]|uniref:hypothetical protein n=1 Tax=Bradyrhizobium sp. 138 TaxID=2782615 RepID=UPI001FF73695|nr:hypothetical protein [Bradyrhizobium sp. 138]MCK1735708.1 S9 family peptidase [Bradyrhizobium sp. 138]